MNSCADFYCTCSPKVSCAFETSASSPTANVPPLCHFVFNCSVPHHRPSKRSPPPVPAIFALAPNAVVRWWSLKGLRQLKSNSVLPRLRLPLLHDITIYITKLSRASARYLSLCLLVQPIPFPRSPRSSLPHHISAVSNASSLFGWVLCFSASPPDAAKPTLPQLNLHNTSVHRKPNGFLQVAVSNARNPTVLMWASCPLARPIQR